MPKPLPFADDDLFQFAVRYRTTVVAEGVPWLAYSLHPATKLGLHSALLALHDRREILEARGEPYQCAVFIRRHGQYEPLTEAGAEHLFAVLPAGDVKWIDLCQCLLPPLPDAVVSSPAAEPPEQLPLFPHTHTPYDDVEELPVHHALDVEV